MEVWLLDLIKVAGPVTAIAFVLLYFQVKDKERMAVELNKDKERNQAQTERLIEVVANNTTAVEANTAMMQNVKQVVEKCEMHQNHNQGTDTQKLRKAG